MSNDNVTEDWHNFKIVFLSILNNIASMKEVCIKQHTEPWVTTDILQRIESRDTAFHVYKTEKSNEAFDHFKGISNEVQTLIYTAKKNYFADELEDNNHNSKLLWKS